VWLTDITGLKGGGSDMFVCAVREGGSRKVLGYSISDCPGADMGTSAVDAAVAAPADVAARSCIPITAENTQPI
jgi:putative transposase